LACDLTAIVDQNRVATATWASRRGGSPQDTQPAGDCRVGIEIWALALTTVWCPKIQGKMKGIVHDTVDGYGHLIVDQCHHIATRSFEVVARQRKVESSTGLSATVTRKDGHHPKPIIPADRAFRRSPRISCKSLCA